MLDDIFDLSGRVALVTGGNGGLGLGMAEGLAKAGADVCVWGRNAERNAEAAARLREYGVEAEAFAVDVSDERQVIDGAAATVERFGRIDSCFANAGYQDAFNSPPFVDSTLADFRKIVEINLDGTYLTMREVAKRMIEQGNGGSLVGTSSIGTMWGSPREHAYVAAKAGVISLMKCLAVELARHEIRANSLLPGWTESKMTEEWQKQSAVMERVLPRIPLRRWGKAEEWAGIAVYLASDASAFHTGDQFRIDGGYGVF